MTETETFDPFAGRSTSNIKQDSPRYPFIEKAGTHYFEILSTDGFQNHDNENIFKALLEVLESDVYPTGEILTYMTVDRGGKTTKFYDKNLLNFGIATLAGGEYENLDHNTFGKDLLSPDMEGNRVKCITVPKKDPKYMNFSWIAD